MSDHSLTLGGLLLTDSTPDPDHSFVFNVIADGMTFGVAQNVREIVVSLLADGDLARTTRHGNREVTFGVEITGPDLASVAQGEAALRREVGVRNSLTWQAPDALTAPTVFDVVDSEMRQTFDDLAELRRRRTFLVTLVCAPFARSAEPVTVPALVSGTTTVAVDTCDTATGWTATRGGGAWPVDTLEPGAVSAWELDNAVGNPPETWTLTRTGAIDVSTTPYIEVEMTTLTAKGGAKFQVNAYADGKLLRPLQTTKLTDGSGYFRVVLDASGLTTVTALKFSHTSLAGYGHIWQGIQVRDIKRSNILPGPTTRQLTRILATGGTERTPASIHVQSSNGILPLGLSIVHTCPEDGSGYSPPLRRWRISGQAEVTSSPAFSGKYASILTTGETFDVPTSALPEGGYILAAYLRAASATTATVAWSTSTIFPGGTIEEGFTNGTETVVFPDDGWHIVPLAILSLPSVRTLAGKVRIIIQVPSGAVQVYQDEAWLFRAGDDCALTIVESNFAHLWLDSPDVDSPVPTVWVGDGADVRVHPGEGLWGMGTHVLAPEGTAVFTGALTVNPAVDATFYRRWHSNAAE